MEAPSLTETGKENRMTLSQSKSEQKTDPGKNRAAGLLYRLLPGDFRVRTGRHLSMGEKERLDRAYRDFSHQKKEDRIGVERWLLAALDRRHPVVLKSFWIVTFLAGSLLLSFQWGMHPGGITRVRFALLGPVFTAMLSPLAFWLLPAYRIRYLLFRLPRERDLPFALFSLISLLWLLFYIRSAEMPVVLRFDLLSLVTVLFAAILVPILEEIFFRELLPAVFSGSADALTGQGFSAAFFSLGQLPSSPAMALQYFVEGLLLSFLRLEKGGILTGILVHALANGIITLVSGI